jgi:hypothetical protein
MKGKNKLYYPTAIKHSYYINKYQYLKNHILEIGNNTITLGQENNSINCGKIQFKIKKGNGKWENIKCVSVLNNKGNKKLHITYKDRKNENINFSRLSIRSKDLSSSSNEEENNNEEENIHNLLKLEPLGKLNYNREINEKQREINEKQREINEKQLNKFFDISTNYEYNLSKLKHLDNLQKSNNKSEINERQKQERILMDSQKINYNRQKENNNNKAKTLANKEESIRLAREAKEKEEEEAKKLAIEAKEKEEAKRLAIEAKKLANEEKTYKNLKKKYLNTSKKGEFEIKKINGIKFNNIQKNLRTLLKLHLKYLNKLNKKNKRKFIGKDVDYLTNHIIKGNTNLMNNRRIIDLFKK